MKPIIGVLLAASHVARLGRTVTSFIPPTATKRSRSSRIPALREARTGFYLTDYKALLSPTQGSPWVAPSLPLPGSGTINPPMGTLEVSGGNLASPLDFLVALAGNNTLIEVAGMVGGPTNSLAGSVNPKNGLLTVTFGNGVGKATTTGKGAILQNAANGGGFFLGTTNAGSMTLQP